MDTTYPIAPAAFDAPYGASCGEEIIAAILPIKTIQPPVIHTFYL